MFSNTSVNLNLLKQRAFNLRWADVEKDVIPLTAADPDFPVAPEISNAIARFAADRYFSYAPIEGYDFFKEAMAGFYQNKRQVPAKPQHILPVDSAAFGIFSICKAFLLPGDEAIVFNPVDFLFGYSIKENGAIPIPFQVPINPSLPLDWDKLEQLITPKTKMICLCNPLNPTGKVFTKEELITLGSIAIKYNLLILSDEIWSDIVFKPSSFTSIASLDEEIRQRTIIVSGFSKSYGLAGLRIGVITAFNDAHFNAILTATAHQSTIHGSNVLSQVAATAAIVECDYWLEAFVLHLEQMRNIIVGRLNATPGFKCFYPEGCYLAFVNINETGLSAQEIYDLLLNKAKVAVVPGLPKWFGTEAEGYIRLSFATSEKLINEAMDRIQKTISSL
jgi:aspartate/methionine/tyrosine aminotransferase